MHGADALEKSTEPMETTHPFTFLHSMKCGRDGHEPVPDVMNEASAS
jgi:hypothetical protein